MYGSGDTLRLTADEKNQLSEVANELHLKLCLKRVPLTDKQEKQKRFLGILIENLKQLSIR